MANRVPLIVDTSTLFIKELPNGDNLDLTGSGIVGLVGVGGTSGNFSGIVTASSFYVDSNVVISNTRELSNIASVDALTKATLESALQTGPNNFDYLNVTGISTLGGGLSQLSVSGISTLGGGLSQLSVSGVSTFSSAVGFGTTATFSDGAAVYFGAGEDLQIYHDGSNSRIVDAGSGELRLDSNSLRIRNAAGTETSAVFVQDGKVELRYDNVNKFETTSSGVVVTGICTASGGFNIGIQSAGTSVVTGPIKTLNFVGAGNTFTYDGTTDTVDISIAGGGGGSETDTSVSSTSATSIYTTPHATNRSVSAVIQITQGSAYQVGRYLVIHDGTTATIIEESAVATGDMLGSFTADINGTDLRILVSMGDASSATVTIIPTAVTV